MLYPHQKEALHHLSNGKILWGGVGSGKSKTAMAYYKQYESPRDVYVITTAKKRDTLDWESEAVDYGIYKTPDATLGGVLTVDSWNNIKKYEDVSDAFFIFDEQRLVGSGAWVKSYLKIAKNNHWILLSATPGDTWLDYVPVFIANGFYRNRTEFIREHVVYNSYSKFPKIDRYLGVGKLNKLRNEVLVHMPYRTSAELVFEEVRVPYNTEKYQTVMKHRWNFEKEAPIKNVPEFFFLLRKVVNTHISRFGVLIELLSRHDKLIVFYNFDYELEILRGLREYTNVAEWNGHKHEEIPDTNSWVYLVQYASGAEGWNCIETNAICFYSLTYSYRQFKQAQGRIDRLNSPWGKMFYYVLFSNAGVDLAVYKALKSKKDFNQSTFLKGTNRTFGAFGT